MNSVDNKNNLEAQLSAYGIVRQADSYSFPLEAEWVKLDSPAYPKIGEILATFSKNKLLKEAMQVYKALTKIDPSRVSVMTKNSWILAISSPYSKPAVAHPSAENTSASSSAVPTAETASSAAAPNTTQSVSSAPASTVQDISASS
ncbi:MAG: hypothetical protein JSS32_10070, partial [Verrucomicrobia bacterium]|nr:hypothetical protein [Verrucomicrobiota bacterium]